MTIGGRRNARRAAAAAGVLLLASVSASCTPPPDPKPDPAQSSPAHSPRDPGRDFREAAKLFLGADCTTGPPDVPVEPFASNPGTYARTAAEYGTAGDPDSSGRYHLDTERDAWYRWNGRDIAIPAEMRGRTSVTVVHQGLQKDGAPWQQLAFGAGLDEVKKLALRLSLYEREHPIGFTCSTAAGTQTGQFEARTDVYVLEAVSPRSRVPLLTTW